MRWITMGCSSVLFVALSGVAHAQQQCTCSVAKVKNGWCGDCKVGYYDAVKMKSRKLFDALAGHDADTHEITCKSCKKALASNGYCKACNIGFVDKKHYHARVGYLLASGEAKDPAKITCAACKKASGDSGWCGACKIGMVGNMAYKDKEDFQRAADARRIVLAAAKSKCETCALAMVTDGECAACKVAYKDGKKVKKP